MADPDFVDDAIRLYDSLLNPPGGARDIGVALIRSSLKQAFAEGKIAGIDNALAIFNPKAPPKPAPEMLPVLPLDDETED